MLNIKLEKFEGPLGLLLQLIESEEMDITQISLAKVADQYIDYIKNSSQIDPDEMADFLVVAARLLLIKSKALLPYLFPEEEEEIEELEQQLRMYKEFLEAAKKVQALIGNKRFMFTREFNHKFVLANVDIFSPPKNLKHRDLKIIFSDLIKRLQPAEILEEEMIEYKVNIEDKIQAIHEMLTQRIKFSFNRLLINIESKTEIIVSFLALLELVKQKDVVAIQGGLFEEIVIGKLNG